MDHKPSSLTRAVKRAHTGPSTPALPSESPDMAYQRRTYPIDLSTIAIIDRFRSIDDTTVKRLVASMKVSGLQTPILVRHNREIDPQTGLYDGTDLGGYALVAGAHRLAAARELRWPRIEALILEELSADEVRLIELDENLMRAELTAFDRARSLERRKELYERIHPESRHGGDRRSQAYLDSTNPQSLRLAPDADDGTNPQSLRLNPDAGDGINPQSLRLNPDAGDGIDPQSLRLDPQSPGRAPSFIDDTAASTPWSPRTIQRAVRIATNILPELQEVLPETPIAQREGDLYRLAGMPEADQYQVLNRIREAKTPPQKLSAVLPDTPPSAPSIPKLDRLKRLWSNASAQERHQFRSWIDQHEEQ